MHGHGHRRLDTGDGAAEQEQSRVAELCVSIVAEVRTDHVTERGEQKHQGELLLESLALPVDPKPHSEHMIENQQVRNEADEADLGEETEKRVVITIREILDVVVDVP